ncbi:hypothetical protein WR25_11817 [Diploscapter pachys]|uniref:aralkylamine N-acetyltransferase n=1 Tax=Diploscapter pachys TaxID=2018661 RepID=A0A2A2KLT9_9BILA|nr:hypothetical protein WR25_11817 [Diploscapter pachys]
MFLKFSVLLLLPVSTFCLSCYVNKDAVVGTRKDYGFGCLIQFDGRIFIQDVAHEDDYNQFKTAEVKKDEGCYFINNQTAKNNEFQSYKCVCKRELCNNIGLVTSLKRANPQANIGPYFESSQADDNSDPVMFEENVVLKPEVTTKDGFKAQKSDRQEIKDFLMSGFLYDEPNSRAQRMTEKSFEPICNVILDRSLESPFSTIVKDKDQMIGVMLNSIWKRSSATDNEYKNQIGDNTLGRILNDCHNSFWPNAPNDINCVIHREIMSVRKDYRGTGIGLKLVFSGLTRDKLQKFEIGGLVSEASSIVSQANLMKRGFTPMKKFLISDYKDENGNPAYVPDDGTTCIILMFMSIDDTLKRI